jgi:acetyltransferase-like isoleucine patch superfamily enzyme
MGKWTVVLRRLLNRFRCRFPGLQSHPDVSYDVRGEFTYGHGCSINTRAQIIVPENTAAHLGDGVYIGRYVELGAGKKIEIGDDTSIQDRCILVGDISVGRYCIFSLNVLITSGTHYPHIRPEWTIRDQDDYVRNDPILAAQHSKPVSIEDDCWLGVNSVILAGVTVGKGCVIGANSVVTRSIPPYSVAAGTPAQVVGSRLQFSPPTSLHASQRKDLPYFYSGFGVSASERDRGAPIGGLLARANFLVAMEVGHARRITITARFCDRPCALRFGENTRELHRDFGELTFPLTPDQQSPLSFSLVGQSGSKWPICVSKIAVD